jgi:hypothetical protein
MPAVIGDRTDDFESRTWERQFPHWHTAYDDLGKILTWLRHGILFLTSYFLYTRVFTSRSGSATTDRLFRVVRVIIFVRRRQREKNRKDGGGYVLGQIRDLRGSVVSRESDGSVESVGSDGCERGVL